MKGLFKGDKSPTWKGDNATYHTKHAWMVKEFGKPKYCEDCKCEDKPQHHYQWANISQKYFRDRKDWRRLCALCHRKFDNSIGVYFPKNRIHELRYKCVICKTEFDRPTKNTAIYKHCSYECRQIGRKKSMINYHEKRKNKNV